MTDQFNHQHEPWSFAAKDILETLPPVWTRGLLYFLITFICVVLPWTMLSKTDEMGVATGKLEPNGYTVKLDSQVSGTVVKVYVKEGNAVKVGQPILSIDSQLVQTDLQQAERKLEGQNSRLTELQKLRTQILLFLTTQSQQNQSQELEKQSQIKQAKENLSSLKNNYRLQVAQKLAQVNQAQTAVKKSQTSSQILKARIGTVLAQLKRRQNFLKDGVVSQDQVDERKNVVMEVQQLYEQTQGEMKENQEHVVELENLYQQTIGQTKSDIAQAQSKLQEQEQSYQSLKHSNQLALLKDQEQLKNTDTNITSLKSEIAQTQTQIKALQIQLSQRIIKATTNGTVFQLPIKKAGAVLQSGTRIVEIAPEGSHLLLRAQLPTSQSSSLKPGLSVKLKFDAYPYQDYGFVLGKLRRVSPTSTEVDTPNGKVTVYQIEIEPAQNCIYKKGQCNHLHAGDTATAEIVTQQRRVIDYVLDPFKRLSQDGLKL